MYDIFFFIPSHSSWSSSDPDNTSTVNSFLNPLVTNGHPFRKSSPLSVTFWRFRLYSHSQTPQYPRFTDLVSFRRPLSISRHSGVYDLLESPVTFLKPKKRLILWWPSKNFSRQLYIVWTFPSGTEGTTFVSYSLILTFVSLDSPPIRKRS